MNEERTLLNLARQICDHESVDWDSLSRLGSRKQSLADDLRIVAEIARFHRELPDSVPPSGTEQALGNWAHLHLIEKIAGGGFGEVFRAWDASLETEVALKLLRSDRVGGIFESSILKEGRMLAKVRHPNVAKVFGVSQDDRGRIGLWMELIRGRTLEDLLRSYGIFGAQEAANIGKDVCRALAAVHRAGLLHRDIKAANVMREEGGRIVLMDFGLGVGRGELDGAKILAGTPFYMAPELLEGEVASIQSDLYAVGVLLFYLVSGEFPVSGSSLEELRENHRMGRSTLLRDVRPDLPGAFHRLVEQACHPAQGKRFESAGSFEQALENSLGSIEISTSEPSRVGRRHLSLFLLFILASLIVLSGSADWSNWYDEANPSPSAEKLTGLRADRHIAILPFSVPDSGAGWRGLGDGLAETLTSRLASVGNFGGWVVPFSEVAARGIDTATDARRILGATLAVTGTIQSESGRLRLTLNLIDTATLRQLDGAVIDAEAGDWVRLQDKVAGDLGRMVGIESKSHSWPLMTGPQSDTAGTEELYLQARGQLLRHDQPARLDAAKKLLQEVLERNPRHAGALSDLARAFWFEFKFTGDPDAAQRAQDYIARAVAVAPRLPSVLITESTIETGTGRPEQGIKTLEAALEVDPNNPDVYRGLARAYEAMGVLDQAEALYRKLLGIRPDYWDDHNTLGVFYYEHGRYEEAVEQFERVVELTPDNYIAHNNLGGLLLYLGRSAEAVETLERSLELHPNEDAHINLGTAYFWERRYQQAMVQFRSALDLNPNTYFTWRNLASAQYFAGELDAAVASYARAESLIRSQLEINPEDALLIADLASTLAMLGRPGEARTMAERALDLAPENVEVLNSGAETFESLGERKRSIELIQQAVALGYPSKFIELNPTFTQLVSDRPDLLEAFNQ